MYAYTIYVKVEFSQSGENVLVTYTINGDYSKSVANPNFANTFQKYLSEQSTLTKFSSSIVTTNNQASSSANSSNNATTKYMLMFANQKVADLQAQKQDFINIMFKALSISSGVSVTKKIPCQMKFEFSILLFSHQFVQL